jgi:glycosyltransferase involved in cell wall biosynthesis
MAGPERRELGTSRRVARSDRIKSRDVKGAETCDDRALSLPAVRVLLVADVRSPHAWGWVDAVRSAGVTVLGVDGQPWPEDRSLIASGEISRWSVKRRLRLFAGSTPTRLKITGRIRRIAGPLLAPVKGRQIRRIVRQAKPDIVHGMRIPYEARAALAACPSAVPLAVSIWGIDFTNDASKSRLAGRATRKILARTDLLFADCQRDIDLAATWGLRSGVPTAVLPGGGGIDLARMDEGISPVSQLGDLLGPSYRLVVNARGRRPYVRNDVLLKALSLLATDLDPCVRILFVDSEHDESLRKAIEHHAVGNRILVIGKCSPGEVLSLFRRAEVSVSITDQDGTPNSLLEAMAAGAIPVCGDLPSIREWIEPGRNGFLAAFDDPQAVAEALRLALSLSDTERRAIGADNARIIATRAGRRLTGTQAAEKYGELVSHREYAVSFDA